jgi:hypothetical protein
MHSLVSPLIRSLAVEFYRRNSGFFLLVITLAFGFMSKVEHVALAQAFGSSRYTMMIPGCLWVIYAIKITLFNDRQLRLPENLVFTQLHFVPLIIRAGSAFIVFIVQFLPAIAYGIFIATAGSPATGGSVIMVAALVGCSITGAGALLHGCRLPRSERNASSLALYLDRHLYKSVTRCYVEYVTRRDPVMVVATKIFSTALLVGVGNLYRYESYDERLLMMTLTVCGFSNLLIVYRIQEFEFLSMAWWRNLPIAIPSRFLRMAAALWIFTLPECIVLLKFFPLQRDAYSTICGLAYLASISCFLQGLILSGTFQMAAFTRQGFLITIALVLCSLFGVPVIILGTACLVTGFTLFRRCYYTFEPPGGAE